MLEIENMHDTLSSIIVEVKILSIFIWKNAHENKKKIEERKKKFDSVSHTILPLILQGLLTIKLLSNFTLANGRFAIFRTIVGVAEIWKLLIWLT